MCYLLSLLYGVILMKIKKIILLPEFHFVEWVENSYKIKKNAINVIDYWLREQGIVSLKKRRQYAIEFIQNNLNNNNLHLDENELKNKLDDFWIEISLRKLLSI